MIPIFESQVISYHKDDEKLDQELPFMNRMLNPLIQPEPKDSDSESEDEQEVLYFENIFRSPIKPNRIKIKQNEILYSRSFNENINYVLIFYVHKINKF